jgi:hypothetical protein
MAKQVKSHLPLGGYVINAKTLFFTAKFCIFTQLFLC